MRHYCLVDGERIWWLHATHGFPLEFSIPMLADRGYVPTWDRLVGAAQADGANMEHLGRRLSHAVGDGYPPEFAAEVRKRMPALIQRYAP